jgi:hypothetical protein
MIIAAITGLLTEGAGTVVAPHFLLSLNYEIALGAAVMLTIVGVLLHWRLPQERIAIEEQMKDGKLTEADGRRRLRIFGLCASLSTIAGVGMILVELLMNVD